MAIRSETGSNMPADFAYMTNSKNLKAIMERVQGAGSPAKFTHAFLQSLGFTSSSDRPAISVLKSLGFLTADAVPTERYHRYRDERRSGQALAEGLREGWSELFLVDREAHKRTQVELVGLFKSTSGKGDASAQKMATTFRVLAGLADWNAPEPTASAAPSPAAELEEAPEPGDPAPQPPAATLSGLNLHHDVHIHLPSTSDSAVYVAIFRALKAELLD